MKAILLVVALCAGCQTQFTGSPHIDPGTCMAKCAQSNLQMSGIVYMGEYSSACICEIPKQPGAPAAAPTSQPAAAVGAAAGVVMQMRRQDQRNNQR
ncbi:MAG: hypothetical protein H6Q90_2661 [Deltaproteobacteria bacterium]|nr:hypothetical protein [Deltaproteobacteria bacterium]